MVQPTSRSLDSQNASAAGGAAMGDGAVAALHAAVGRGDLAEIGRLAQSAPALLSQADAEGNAALHRALLCGGDPRTVEWLLHHGADPTQPNGDGDTALHLAFARRPASPELVRTILRHLDRHGRHGDGQDGLLLTLTARNADLKTPAAVAGDVNAAEFGPMLGDMVVDYLDWLHHSGTASFAEAVGRGDVPAMTPWLARADALALPLSPMGHGALAIAAGRGHVDAMQALLDAGKAHGVELVNLPAFPGGETPLARAATYGRLGAVQLLIAHGADLDAPDRDGRTALMRAAVYGHVDVVLALLDAGADVGVQQVHGWTALAYAAAAQHPDVVRALLAHGADSCVHQRNAAMRTPLMLAVGADELAASPASHRQLIDLLLEGGANIDAGDEYGMTPLMLAAQLGDTGTVLHLRDAGASVRARNGRGQTAADVARAAGHADIAALLEPGGARPQRPRH